jgi:hypothetical protein
MGALTNLIIHAGNIVTRKVDRSVFDWMLAASSFLDDFNSQPTGVAGVTDASGGLRSSGSTAFNTLIEPNISFPEWAVPDSTHKLTHIETLVTLLDGTWINPLKNTAGTGRLHHQFTVNPGATGGTFFVRMKMPTGVANNTVALFIMDSNATTVLFTTVVTVTNSANGIYSLVATGLFPNHLYWAQIRVNDTGQQANPIIAQCTFVPNGGTGTFAINPDTGAPAFVRIGLAQNLATSNELAGWNGNSYPYVNCFADYILNTSALSIAVEAFNNSSDGIYWLLYGGLPYKSATPVASQTIAIQDFTDLPIVQSTPSEFDLSARPMSFTIRAGLAGGPIGPPNYAIGTTITAPRAVYLPLSASFSFAQNNSDALCVYAGDSIASGAGGVAGFQAPAVGMRDVYPGGVICENAVSQGLFNYVGPGNDPAKQKNLALYLSRDRPRDTVIDLGTNDKANNLWPVAQFQTALQAVVTNMLSFNPNGRIWLKSPCITTIEGANGSGDTMPNYRTAIAAVVTAIADTRVIFIDGTNGNFGIAADLIDTVHFNSTGLAKNREALLNSFAGASILGPAV